LKKLRWSRAAANDLEEISIYLREHHAHLSVSTVRRIYETAKSLRKFPERGRPGIFPGTRELVLAPLPYLIQYSVDADFVYVLRILHGAQDWTVQREIG